MATIIDIAKVAGVSKSTVSRVLSNAGSCKKETREKVMAAAAQLNYKPNWLARAMVTKKTGIIGVIIYRKHMPLVSHPFYSVVLDAIIKETKKAGYSILVMADDEISLASGDQFLQHQVDGLILMSRVTEDFITHFKQMSVPFVLINNTAIVKDSSYVVNDDYLGAYDAALHLIDRKYKNIAYVSGPLEHRSYRLRWEGFQAALSYKGFELKPYHRFIGDLGVETGLEAAYFFFKHEDRPDAVFASNDMIAIGVLKALFSMNLKVPHDVAVMGFDDIEFAKLTTPALTTVHVDKRQMGVAAVKQLLAMINDPSQEFGKTILQSRVIVRETT